MIDEDYKVLSTQEESGISLNLYDSIDYRHINEYLLFDRVDTKYVMNVSQLKKLLDQATQYYKLVTYDDARSSNCSNRYYDTPMFGCYLDHHNGKRRRHKVRIRSYVDSGLAFVEVKARQGMKRTIKYRVPYEEGTNIRDDQYQDLLDSTIGSDITLESKLINSFNRITLVNKNALERITIDTQLTYNTTNKKKVYQNLVIMEVKSRRRAPDSAMVELLKKLKIRATSISKYCIGISNMYPEIKANNFKTIHRKIASINYKI